MKKIIGILLLTVTLALGSDGTKDTNPGLLDDPGCQTLIKNQLRDAKENPKDYTIVYYDTSPLTDNGGAINQYLVTKKANGKQVLVSVALHFKSLSATPLPSPLPPPSTPGLALPSPDKSI